MINKFFKYSFKTIVQYIYSYKCWKN